MQHLYLNILFSLPIKYQKKTPIFKFCIITKKYLQYKLAKGKIHKTRMSSHRQETQSLRSQEIHIQTKRTIVRKKNDIHKKPHLKIKNLTCEMISSKDHHINLKRKRKPIFSTFHIHVLHDCHQGDFSKGRFWFCCIDLPSCENIVKTKKKDILNPQSAHPKISQTNQTNTKNFTRQQQQPP